MSHIYKIQYDAMEGTLVELLSLLLHPRRFIRKKTLWYDIYRTRRYGNEISVSNHADCTDVRINCMGKGNKIVLSGGNFHGLHLFCHGNDGAIIIGNDVVVNAFADRPTTLSVIGATQIVVESNCLISDSVIMQTSDYHKVYDMETGILQNADADIRIGQHCWIGNRVTINKGVCVAHDSIIGNCSVVTKKFDEPNVVIAGNPAVVKKRNVIWTY